MRKALVLFLFGLFGLLLIPRPVHAVSIGYVHLDRVLQEYKDLQDAKRELQRFIREKERVRDSLRALVDSARARLERERVMLTDEEKILREREIQQYEQAYQQYWRQVWGENGEVKQKTRELLDPLIKKVHETVYKLAQENGYDLVLDLSSDAVLYASGENDFTDDVIAELNKAYVGAETQFPLGKARLAVFPLKEEGQEAAARDLGTKLADYLRQGFQSSPKFEVLSQGQVMAEVNRRNLDLQNLQENDCYQMALALQTDLYTYGVVTKRAGEQVEFTVRLYSTLDHKLLAERQGTSVDRDADLAIAARNLALQLATQYQP